MLSFTLGQRGADYLKVQVLDQRWVCPGYLRVEVEIKAGKFSGRLETEFSTHEVVQLYRELRALYFSLSGSLTFSPLEGNLEFKMSGDGRGHFEVDGVARDGLVDANELSFVLLFDQTEIPSTIREMEEMVGQLKTTI